MQKLAEEETAKTTTQEFPENESSKVITQTTVEVTLTPNPGSAPSIPEVTVYPGDILLFHVGRQKVTISFPAAGVFPTAEIVTTQTGDVSVWIPDNATTGEYHYAIYVHSVGRHGTYAVGNSHPVMIVKSPRP